MALLTDRILLDGVLEFLDIATGIERECLIG